MKLHLIDLVECTSERIECMVSSLKVTDHDQRITIEVAPKILLLVSCITAFALLTFDQLYQILSLFSLQLVHSPEIVASPSSGMASKSTSPFTTGFVEIICLICSKCIATPDRLS
mmetsp:Transcript_30660/g.71926  ORF Transcript_30660/g.71926 Transcript_30660/m.71926 type:complete len:115 (+) Transcript_30660:268-612(+)